MVVRRNYMFSWLMKFFSGKKYFELANATEKLHHTRQDTVSKCILIKMNLKMLIWAITRCVNGIIPIFNLGKI